METHATLLSWPPPPTPKLRYSNLNSILVTLPANNTFTETPQHNDHTLADTDAHPTLLTTSTGKVFTLTALAAVIDGIESLATGLNFRGHTSVGASGLVQFMHEADLSLGTLSMLVRSLSDNDVANALLDHLGIARVQQISAELGIPHTRRKIASDS